MSMRARGRLAVCFVFLALAFPHVGPMPLAPAKAQEQFTCTQIIGYSTTSTWFPAAEGQLDNSRWQLLWTNGGAVHRWADPSFPGWANAPVSPCMQGARSPDRIVLDVATNDYTTDVELLESDIRRAIDTVRRKYGSVRQIMLQPEHGGPDHSPCPWRDAPLGVNRATYNHPAIEAAIGRVVGGDIVQGPDPLVRKCSDFADSIGHVTASGADALGASNGAFYAGTSPTPATQIPPSTPTPPPATPTTQSTPTPLPTEVALPPEAAVCPCSLVLNGRDAYAEAPHTAELDLTGDWTVEAWFKDEDPRGYHHPRARIISKGDTGSAEAPFFLDIDADRLWAGRRVDSTSEVIGFDLGANDVSADTWRHVAATFQRSTLRLTLYLDGEPVAQGSGSGSSSGNELPVSIGRNGGRTANFWQGKLDDVRVWNLVRSAEEIQRDYLVELETAPEGLVANWRFNEGAGSTAADSAGIQNATLVGGAWWSPESPVGPPPDSDETALRHHSRT